MIQKLKAIQCHHSTSPRNKQFKTQLSTGKCMLTIFWDYRGMIHQVCMLKGMEGNSGTYVESLKRQISST
jgi:hypothetical protein